MPYLPDALPLPEPTFEDAPFWAHCDEKRLMFQRCTVCSKITHPPIEACPRCQSEARGWVDAPAKARVFSFTWAFTPAHPSVAEALPYNVALIEFPDMPGLRLISNVINVKPGELAIGDNVALIWETTASGRSLPRFRKT